VLAARHVDGRDKPVALARDRLDEAWILRIVPQGVADLPDRGVDSVLGIDEDFPLPEPLGNFGPGDQLAAVPG
jgi:hypothetical protein